MQAVIYYFTGTNNTLKVCELYQKEFEKRDITCDLIPMYAENIPNPDEYDLIGFAYPIHGFNAPYIVYKFIRNLPKVENKKYFILKTSGEPIKLNNASSSHVRAKLKKKGFVTLTNEYHYVMPYNMIFRHTDLQAQKMWDTAQKLVPIDIDEILAEKTSVLKCPPFGRFVTWLFRIEHPAMKINGKFFKVKKSCIKCQKCVKSCPVSNITYDEGKNKFVFGKKCIMCARCSFNCPKDSIKIGVLNGWRVNGAYKFEGEADPNQKCKKPNYCKKAYARYYKMAEEKIERYSKDNQ